MARDAAALRAAHDRNAQAAARFLIARRAQEPVSQSGQDFGRDALAFIVLSSWAGAKGGFGALGLAKQAKAEYETAIAIDSKALGGSALNGLGVLYYKVLG